MTFYVERYDGLRWTCLRAAESYINPSVVGGPAESYPPANTVDNATAFAGLPGHLCRVRFNEQTMELYEWDKVLQNPADEASFPVWGWKLVRRNQIEIRPDQIPLGEFSWLG